MMTKNTFEITMLIFWFVGLLLFTSFCICFHIWYATSPFWSSRIVVTWIEHFVRAYELPN